MVPEERGQAQKGRPPIARASEACHPVEQALAVVSLHGPDATLERHALLVIVADQPAVAAAHRYRRPQHVG